MSFNARNLDDYASLYDYLQKFAGGILYPSSQNRFYSEGKQTAVRECLQVIRNDQDNRESLESFIYAKEEYYKNRIKDEYMNGYLDGLKLMENQLKAVKFAMMEKVKKLLQ